MKGISRVSTNRNEFMANDNFSNQNNKKSSLNTEDLSTFFSTTAKPSQKSKVKEDNNDGFSAFEEQLLKKLEDEKNAKKHKEQLAKLSAFEYKQYGGDKFIITKFIDPIYTKIEVPSSVLSIGKEAFKDSSVTEVSLPNGLIRIEAGAFQNCKYLRKLNIPDTVDFIGDNAFLNCSKLEVIIPENCSIVGENVLKGTLTEEKEIKRQIKLEQDKKALAEKKRLEIERKAEEERRKLAEEEKQRKLLEEQIKKKRLEEEKKALAEKKRLEAERKAEEERRRQEEIRRQKIAEEERRRLAEKEKQRKILEEQERKRKLNENANHYYDLALRGDVNAMVIVGELYYYGNEVVSRSLKEAFYWFMKAAEQGNVNAMEYVGDCYYNGYGVYKDLKEASKWYKRASK